MQQVESKKSIDKKIENAGDPSALNAQEVSVVDMFAEGYNPSMPSGGGGGGGGFKDDAKDHAARQKAKKKLENKLRLVQKKVLLEQ